MSPQLRESPDTANFQVLSAGGWAATGIRSTQRRHASLCIRNECGTRRRLVQRPPAGTPIRGGAGDASGEDQTAALGLRNGIAEFLCGVDPEANRNDILHSGAARRPALASRAASGAPAFGRQ